MSLVGPRLFHALVTIRVEASFASDCIGLLQAFTALERGQSWNDCSATAANDLKLFVATDFSFKKERFQRTRKVIEIKRRKRERERES